MDIIETLRSRRKALVVAAEAAMEQVFTDTAKPKIKKAQLNHLIAVCGEATCTEEIENYLRYQSARGDTGWAPIVDDVIKRIGEPLAGLDDDRLRVEAWRLYAVFLTRAFTYRNMGERR